MSQPPQLGRLALSVHAGKHPPRVKEKSVARRTLVTLVDDVDGSEAAETVSFALDGVSLEIDLSAENAALLRGALAPFLGVARKAGTTGKAPKAPTKFRPGLSPRDRDRSKVIREWAAAAGKRISPRGRIPADVVAEFDACGGVLPAPAEPEELDTSPGAAVAAAVKKKPARRVRAAKPKEEPVVPETVFSG